MCGWIRVRNANILHGYAKTRNSVDEWYPTAYGLVTNTHSSIMSIKLLCGFFFFKSHIPVMQPAPLWKRILSHPEMDGYSLEKDGRRSFAHVWWKPNETQTHLGEQAVKKKKKAAGVYRRTIFGLQVNRRHHYQQGGGISSFCPQCALPDCETGVFLNLRNSSCLL